MNACMNGQAAPGLRASLFLWTCTVEAGSHSPLMATEPLKCGQSELGCALSVDYFRDEV